MVATLEKDRTFCVCVYVPFQLIQSKRRKTGKPEHKRHVSMYILDRTGGGCACDPIKNQTLRDSRLSLVKVLDDGLHIDCITRSHIPNNNNKTNPPPPFLLLWTIPKMTSIRLSFLFNKQNQPLLKLSRTKPKKSSCNARYTHVKTWLLFLATMKKNDNKTEELKGRPTRPGD